MSHWSTETLWDFFSPWKSLLEKGNSGWVTREERLGDFEIEKWRARSYMMRNPDKGMYHGNGKVHVCGILCQALLPLRFRAMPEWSTHHYHLTLTLTFTERLLTLLIMISAFLPCPRSPRMWGIRDSAQISLIPESTPYPPDSAGCARHYWEPPSLVPRLQVDTALQFLDACLSHGAHGTS